ncbi:MAG TPA: hypothetical protein VGR40_02270 [Candidatus Binatus sp.]|nr:hypothetical protein [Candidatus Binatus sp.]
MGAVGVPYLALLAFAVLQRPGLDQTLAEQITEFGIDLCVLGLGVSGALFSADSLGRNAPPIVVAALLLELVISGICLRLKEGTMEGKTKATLCVSLGVLILAINTGVAIVWR